ncbi:MAG: hypothetical protein LBJ12_09010 [Oscillospiraceae bacterium]|jgi:hypothetical protein|nr:hypothetical protein [Oscillospiraceae bacterium]
MKKAIAALVVFVVLGASSLAVFHNQLDVVGNGAVKAFDKMVQALPESSLLDDREDKTAGLPATSPSAWHIYLPGDSDKFVYSQNTANPNVINMDVFLEIALDPFINAGLHPEQLPENYQVLDLSAAPKAVAIGGKLGDKTFSYKDDEITPAESFRHIASFYRNTIGYHAEMGHYNIDLGSGNMFEWAKDIRTNGKDIVFVLNPEPFIAAGVDPEKVEGWTYAQVPAEENGKMVQVWKLLKPFDLAVS